MGLFDTIFRNKEALERAAKEAQESQIWKHAEQLPEIAEANALKGGVFENKPLANLPEIPAKQPSPEEMYGEKLPTTPQLQQLFDDLKSPIEKTEIGPVTPIAPTLDVPNRNVIRQEPPNIYETPSSKLPVPELEPDPSQIDEFIESSSVIPARATQNTNISDDMARMEAEGGILADKILPKDATPSQRSAMIKRLIAGGAIAGAGYGAYKMFGGGSPQDPAQRAIGAAVAAPAPKQEEKAPVEPTKVIPAREQKVTSGVKPIAPEVKGTSQASVSNTIEETGPETINTVENLEDAQQRRNMAQLTNRLGKAGELLGTAFSGAKPVAQQAFDEQIKDAENIVTDFEKKAEQEKNDPNSQVSREFREYYERLTGQTANPKMSLNNGMKIMPYAVQRFMATEAQKARREQQAVQLQSAKDLKEMTLEAARIGAVGKQREKDSDEKRLFTQKLRTELQSKEYGKMLADYTSSARNAAALESFSKNPTGYSDYGMLMSSLKALQGDQSVVREAEIRLGKDATSLFNKLQNYVSSAATGRSLQPNQRQDMINAISQLKDITKSSYIRNIQPVLEQARAEGIDETVLLPEALRNPQAGSPSPSAPAGEKKLVKKGYNAKTNQTQLVYSDGTKEIVQGKQ